MPRFEMIEDLPAPLGRVFDFFSRPANLLKISPPELHAQLVSAPSSCGWALASRCKADAGACRSGWSAR